MITSPLTGNIGNHMFIYAIIRMVAEKNGYDYGFNPHPEFDYHKGKPQMDFMDINYGKIHSFTYNNKPDWAKHIWKEYYEHKTFENGDAIDFHPYQPDVFDIEDNIVLYIRCMQDARYYDKEKLKNWFKIKAENGKAYKTQIKEYNIDLNKNLTILNVRGGEYKGVSSLLLRKKYWNDAISIMLKKNSNMRFLCVTDDVDYANKLLDHKVPVVHFGIGADYYIINNAKNLILSNSSFAIFPTWLNENNPFVIAPRYWARHNISNGYYASSGIWTFGWNFLDKDGKCYER